MTTFHETEDLEAQEPSRPERRVSAALSEKVQSLRLAPQVEAGRAANAKIPWVLCLILAVITGVLAYEVSIRSEPAADSETENSTAAQPASSPAKGGDKATSAMATPAADGNLALDNKGYIIPAHQILVSPKINGMIVKSFIVEGKRVTKGEILAELESIDYQADLDRAKAVLESARQRLIESQRGSRLEEIAGARAELAESEAQRKQLEALWKRSKELVKRQVVSDTDFEEAESKYLAMDRRVARLKSALALMEEGPRIERKQMAAADVRLAEAELAKAQWRLDNCTIRAPISGMILKKNAEEGNIVNPVAFNGSYSLCDVADLADLEVDLSIQERDVSRVFQGQRCTIRAEAYPDRVYQGYVSRLMPIADRAKGAVPVRVKVVVPAEEEGVYLKPEMGAMVSFFKEKATIPPAGGADKKGN